LYAHEGEGDGYSKRRRKHRGVELHRLVPDLGKLIPVNEYDVVCFVSCRVLVTADFILTCVEACFMMIYKKEKEQRKADTQTGAEVARS
jgi:hypothetical protein